MVNRKETNLNGVKAMARTLLYTDINQTAYSPMIVQHPFTNTGFTMVMRNGEPQCIDITADSNALHEWRKMVCQQIDSAKSAFEIYMMTNNYNTNVKIHSYPNGNRVSASTVTRLFKNLCNIFRDKFDDENRRTIYTPAVDKRIRREDEAKRNAELIYD